MNPDGISYLDLSSDAIAGGPSKLVNGYWSPAYPALISITMAVFHPSPEHEFPLVHFVNFLLFAFALWAFSFFLRRWVQPEHIQDDAGDKTDEDSSWVPFAYCAFLWFTLQYIGVEVITPDLCVAGVVFLAAGLCCRLTLAEPSSKHYVALGLILGIGYYAKAAMFPLGLALLVLLFIQAPLSNGLSRARMLLSLSVFLLVVSPLVIALSMRAHSPSFGEAGRLNYAWYVNGLRWEGDGKPGTHVTLNHPAPKVSVIPLAFNFDSQPRGTYPPWYDPSYWYAGTKGHFDLQQQITTIRENARRYKFIALESMPFISGIVVFLAIALHDRRPLTLPRGLLWQMAWPVIAFSMYALVHVERRFLGAFLVLLGLSVYRTVTYRVDRRLKLAVFATVICIVMPPFVFSLKNQAVRSVGELLGGPTLPEYQKVAKALTGMGLRAGDHLAAVGYAYNCDYARYGRYRITAQIPGAEEFWHLDQSEVNSTADRLASIGVKAVVAFNRPDTSVLAGWRDVAVSDSTHLSVLLLSEFGRE